MKLAGFKNHGIPARHFRARLFPRPFLARPEGSGVQTAAVVLQRKEANLIHFLCSLAFVRHFRCDCGNGKFPGFTCTLFPVSSHDGKGGEGRVGKGGEGRVGKGGEGRVRKGEWGGERRGEGRGKGQWGGGRRFCILEASDGAENNSI